MNGLHLHLVLSHLPVLGVLFGTLLLLAGLVRRSRAVEQTALTALVLSGIVAGVTYLTGEGAEEGIEHRVSGADLFIERHEEAAILALVIVGIAALVALVTLIHGRRGRPLSRLLLALSLMGAIGATGAFTWVANLGGQVGHPEIRPNAQAGLVPQSETEHQR